MTASNSKKGLPIIISAPSGAGKSTIAAELKKSGAAVIQSISCTTRAPRGSEKNGVDYFFHTEAEFKNKIERGDLLEWAQVHGHYYGTPKAAFEENLSDGKDVVLTIDPQGAVAMKKIYPDGIYIFVVPPSWDSLAKRLKKRATDDDASTEVRLKNAKKELTYLDHYDYIVVNDLLDDAVDDVAAIIRAEHCRRVRLTSDQVPFLK